MKILFTTFILFLILQTNAQVISAINIGPDTGYENIFIKKLYNDSLTSTFIIWIKKEVVLHKHDFHTEQVYVLEGEAEMRMGDEWKEIKAGDVIFIPIGVAHAVKVTSIIPLKVLSIQTPEFDGIDRIIVNE